jgi:hypothetical protein
MTEAYTLEQVLARLKLAPRSFYTLKKAGRLPMLEELKPRVGRRARYRADLIERWVSGQWEQPRAFFKRGR